MEKVCGCTGKAAFNQKVKLYKEMLRTENIYAVDLLLLVLLAE